jgi:hypothetical protein
MENWHEVTFSDDDIAAHRHMRLQQEFEALFMANHGPADAALFDNEDITQGHRYYFSPGAVRFCGQLLTRWGGFQCPRPRLADLGALLVGNADAKKTLFADEGNS